MLMAGAILAIGSRHRLSLDASSLWLMSVSVAANVCVAVRLHC